MLVDGLVAIGSYASFTRPTEDLSEDDIAAIAASGLAAMNVSLGGRSAWTGRSTYERVRGSIGWCMRQISRNPEKLLPILRGSDFESARRTKRTGLMLGIQDRRRSDRARRTCDPYLRRRSCWHRHRAIDVGGTDDTCFPETT
ncbi:hypothetical protein [Sphingorhabdus contaminans]|uniref:hypothetical protein n=1 Tax=Sphingorhabdus contaminans TaxID=1343899 RepID=UPI003D2AB76F